MANIREKSLWMWYAPMTGYQKFKQKVNFESYQFQMSYNYFQGSLLSNSVMI